MTAWCTAHPWLTFFIVLALISAIRGVSLISISTGRKDKP